MIVLLKSLWVQVRWNLPMWVITVACSWLPDNRVALRLRGALARPFIRKCGRGLMIGKHVTILNPYELSVGDNVYIAHGAWLNCMGRLTLEDEVVFGPYVVISTLQHVFKDDSVRFGGSIAEPVAIGRGAWLAAHVSVKCGVVVGAGTIVGANSFVSADLPAKSLCGGVPARVLGPRRDREAEFHDRLGFLNRDR